MSSLADELLNDIKNAGGESSGQVGISNKRKAEALDEIDQDDADDVGNFRHFPGGTNPAEELDEEDVKYLDLGGVVDILTVAKLDGSQRMIDTMRDIERHIIQPSNATAMSLNNPESALTTVANNLSVEIENDILIIQKFISDQYRPRFPGLRHLVPDPRMFIQAVRAIGNGADLSGVNFNAVLPPAIAMVVAIAAATTKGQALTEAAWNGVLKASDMADRLENCQTKIFGYIQSRVSAQAPNLTAVVGATTAARLLGAAGGLGGLVNAPTRIHLLGAQKKILAGFSTTSQNRHAGFIMQSDLVRAIPPEYRLKAQQIVGIKCARAASVDLYKRGTDGTHGRMLRQQIEERLQGLAEPPPAKLVKALPIPDDGTKKQKGGKSARKAKATNTPTELSKLQNRVAFGEAEEEIGAFGQMESTGMIGTGRVRAMAVDDRSKAKMSKANKSRTQALTRAATSSQAGVSGTSSSLSFSSAQGLEIVKPQAAADEVKAANERWFS